MKSDGPSFSFPGAGGGGGLGGGFPGGPNLGNIFSDPDIMSAMQVNNRTPTACLYVL